MADVKISALPASTTPLAGTEVLPIVQSATTRQVSVANLTAGRAVSALSITASSLTSGRVTYAGTAGLLQDSASLTFDGTTVTTPRLALGGTTLPSAGTATLFSRTSDNSIYLQTGSGNNINFLDGSQNTMVTFSPTALIFQISNAEKMRLDSGGNLLVGSTSSYAGKFQSWGAVTANAGTPNITAIDTTSMVAGVGGELAFIGQYQVGDYAYFGSIRGIKENATSGNTACALTFSVRPTATAPTERMRISSAGIVTMSAYGAGAATFDASGVISSVSDETWKTKDGVPTNTDAMLQKLEPGYWFYNNEKKETFGEERQLGFYAQNVHEAIGEEAAPTPEEGKPWGYYDRSVLAITVMSLKTALNTIEELKQRITALENK
jgi:hypothetical protein